MYTDVITDLLKKTPDSMKKRGREHCTLVLLAGGFWPKLPPVTTLPVDHAVLVLQCVFSVPILFNMPSTGYRNNLLYFMVIGFDLTAHTTASKFLRQHPLLAYGKDFVFKKKKKKKKTLLRAFTATARPLHRQKPND